MKAKCAWIAIISSVLLVTSLWSQNAQEVPPQSGTLQLNSPKMDDRIAQDFVLVQYALRNPAVVSSPSFLIRLDDRDPVTTRTTEYTFTDLVPGVHSVNVALVGANGLPIQDSSATARFTVLERRSQDIGGVETAASSDAPARPAPPANGNSALPILSVIGFGVLVGGIFSALRSR